MNYKNCSPYSLICLRPQRKKGKFVGAHFTADVETVQVLSKSTEKHKDGSLHYHVVVNHNSAKESPIFMPEKKGLERVGRTPM